MTGLNIGGVGSPPVITDLLYAAIAGPNTTSDLYTLDPATAAETSVGPIGFAVTGLAFDPISGVLYGVTSANSASNPRSLITVNTTTGAGTLVGSTGIPGGAIADIGFRSDGALYGYRSTTRTLYSIDTATGTATEVSATTLPFPSAGYGCDFDGTDLLFVCTFDDDAYHTVDETTGALTSQATLINSPTGGGWPIAACSFTSPATLWALDNHSPGDYLVTIDTLTGVITNIGQVLDNFDALAWNVRATAGAPHPN